MRRRSSRTAEEIASAVSFKVSKAPIDRQLDVLQHEISNLPSELRPIVSQFVVAAINHHEKVVSSMQHKDESRKRISHIALMALALSALIVITGIFLVYIGENNTGSSIRIFGNTVETKSARVVGIFIGAIIFIYIGRDAIKSLK